MKVFYVQYANPAAFPPIEYSSQILAEAGVSVRFVGVHSQGSESMKFPDHPNIHVEVAPYTPPGWRQKIAYLVFLLRVILIARTWKPDWLYVSDSMASPAGWLMCRFFGMAVIYHEHDSPVEAGQESKFIQGIMGARKALACRAEWIVFPQRERIALFQKSTGTQRPVLQVWNCPRYQETLVDMVHERQPGEPLCVYFHGSLNLDRVPLALISGAARSGVPVKIRVVGYETIGSQGTSERLKQAVAESGGQVELELPGAKSRYELPQQMAGMHVGWINFINRSGDINLTHMVGASNKAFDYLAVGLPLIVPQSLGWEEMFVAPGYAKSCDPSDVEAIADALRWFYEKPAEAAAMGRAGQQRTREEWNYERQFAPVLERIQMTVKQ
ncbi:MAG: glycosyltransferase [Verrucomicrobiota bacterium]